MEAWYDDGLAVGWAWAQPTGIVVAVDFVGSLIDAGRLVVASHAQHVGLGMTLWRDLASREAMPGLTLVGRRSTTVHAVERLGVLVALGLVVQDDGGVIAAQLRAVAGAGPRSRARADAIKAVLWAAQGAIEQQASAVVLRRAPAVAARR